MQLIPTSGTSACRAGGDACCMTAAASPPPARPVPSGQLLPPPTARRREARAAAEYNNLQLKASALGNPGLVLLVRGGARDRLLCARQPALQFKQPLSRKVCKAVYYTGWHHAACSSAFRAYQPTARARCCPMQILPGCGPGQGRPGQQQRCARAAGAYSLLCCTRRSS